MYRICFLLEALSQNFKKQLLAHRVSPSIHVAQFGSYCTYFHEILSFEHFLKICSENSLVIKYDKKRRDLCTFMLVSHQILLRMRNVSDRSCRENKKHTFYLEEYGRARQVSDVNIIIHFACWITKASDTSSEYVIWQQQLYKHT